MYNIKQINSGTEACFTVKIKNIMIRNIFYFVFLLQNITRGLNTILRKPSILNMFPTMDFFQIGATKPNHDEK